MTRWSAPDAQRWWSAQPWPVGCNFIPSTAINQLEMWQAETYDRDTIARELDWLADFGFNTVRVYLHDLLWEADAAGFAMRIGDFLGEAESRGIRTMLVLFDDVWSPDPHLGSQPAPHPGRHNSGWLESPGLPALHAYPTDAALRERLERYVRGVLAAFGADPRVWLWDLYNEPGGHPAGRKEPVGAACLPLLRDVFAWARDAAPSQPLTSALWSSDAPQPPEIAALQRAESDVISFHHYGSPEALSALCDRLRSEEERPLLCSEYLARSMQSRFETHLPRFRARDIGAIHWGWVSGKTQTIYPWWSWLDKEPQPEPEVWFHDVLRADGTPFDADEAAFLRRFLRPEAPG